MTPLRLLLHQVHPQRLRYAPFLVQLVVTRRCNLKCSYCTEFDQHSEPVPTSVLEARIDQIASLGTWALELTGGEPLLHPEIVHLVRYARQRVLKVMMISNAFLLTEQLVRELNAAGLQEMQVSVDGVEPNETTIKVLKPLRKKLEMLAREARFPVVLSSVLGSSGVAETLAVVRFAREQGFRPRCLVLHDDQGQLELDAEGLRRFAQVQEAIGQPFAEARDYRSRLIHEGSAPFKCRSGSRYLYVDENGDVCWCSQTRDRFEKPLAAYTAADLRAQFHTPKNCNATCTIGCARTCSAPDEWRAQDPRRVR